MDEEKARLLLEKVRWPDGIRCISCSSIDIVENRNHIPTTHRCRLCGKKFGVRTGWVLSESRTPLSRVIELILESYPDGIITEDRIYSSMKKLLPRVLPSAIYKGILPLAGMEIDCAVLDDKDNTRLIGIKSIFTSFNRISSRGTRKVNIPAFMDANNLQPYINSDILAKISPIEYKSGTSIRKGYNALTLPLLCEIYLTARREGALTTNQLPLADRAEMLQLAFAKVGMIALVDEATGFQRDRKHDVLRELLSKYIEEGLQKWIHTFPNDFFAELDRLYDNKTASPRARPQHYGHFINKYVYEPLENGYVKAELNRLNINDDGKRKARFHQWLSVGGREMLLRHMGGVKMLMKISNNVDEFKKNFRKNIEVISIAPDLFNHKGIIKSDSEL